MDLTELGGGASRGDAERRRGFLKKAAALGVTPAVAQALAHASAGRALAQAPARDQTLRLPGSEPLNFDVGRVGGNPGIEYCNLLFDGLTFYNWDTNVVEPVIATAWEYDPSTLTFVFHLRNDVRWTTGQPVTAADFEYAWKRNLSPQLASVNVSFLGYIKGGVAYNKGEAEEASVGVRAIDDVTLEVQMEAPTPFFPMICSLWPLFPLNRAAIERGGDDKWMEPSNIVSAGPFSLTGWDHDQQLVFTRNPTYWGRRPSLERIVYRLYENPARQALAAYEADELDFAAVPPAESDRVMGDRRLSRETVRWPESRNWQLRLDMRNTKSVIADVNVRKALYLAIDRELIVRQLLKGQGTPAWTLLPPDIPANNPGARLLGGPAEARKFLETAGFPGGRNFPGFKLVYVATQNEATLVSQAIAQMWKEVLNITVELVPAPTDWRQRIRTEPYDMYYGGWGSDYLDPNDWHNVIFEGDFWQSHYTDPTYLNMIKQADITADPDLRIQRFAEAETYLIRDQVATIPLFHGSTLWIQKPWVRNLRVAPLNTYVDPRDAWIGAH